MEVRFSLYTSCTADGYETYVHCTITSTAGKMFCGKSNLFPLWFSFGDVGTALNETIPKVLQSHTTTAFRAALNELQFYLRTQKERVTEVEQGLSALPAFLSDQ